jgi:hypothetical protein
MIRRLATLILLTPFLTAYADMSDLHWLAGCWSQDGREAGSVEQWTAPAGGTMLGISRLVSGGKTVAFEYLRIIEDEDGWIGLIASPSGQETARFQLVRRSEREVIFENPDHDFPQRIIYRLIDNGKLLARIEGEVDSKERTVDFPMTRMQCDSGHEPG